MPFQKKSADTHPTHTKSVRSRNFQLKGEADELMIYTLESEIDEMLSFVGKKANKQWIWIALEIKAIKGCFSPNL